MRRISFEALICWATLIVVTVGLFFLITLRVGSPGEGVSVGTIVNVANHGVLWSRPEIYVLHAGEMKAEEYGISEEAVSQAQAYSSAGIRVRVHYTEYLTCWAWNYANCSVVDRIEPDPIAVEE